MIKTPIRLYPEFEFHVAKKIRKKYGLNDSFFSLSGNVVFANFYQVRLFVQKINEKRPISAHISPGEINGAGLLDEIYHIAIKNYIKSISSNIFQSAVSNVEEIIGGKNFDNLLLEFIKVFPPQQVYKNEVTEVQYLEGYTGSISNREILLEELILLHFANRNPAFGKIKELFDENYLGNKTTYKSAISTLKTFFGKDELKIGQNNYNLFDFLSMPFIKHSNSIWDQLEYIKNEWGIFISKELLIKIQSSKDLFTESIKFEPNFDVPTGGAPTIVPQYKGKKIDADSLVIGKSKFKYAEDSTKDYDEPEQFTPDTNWMPNLVLIAKNIYVWLDQLSKKYKREISKLDQIPIEELEQLRKWNINGLWLIGVWERSSASKKIKHLMGNIDAVASAYSLYDYQIANDLGGESAYKIFNENAKSMGIRLASDMVPNHTGLYSKWMVEHPDYFIQLDHPPFPNYSFTGENLSEHSDFELRLEDQYWEMKDAAVVFERKDLRNGTSRYIYHGNDGTNMPWNDTAQLNLLKEEVRESLISKIFEVARKFSVIRFDAAMTLAKKHFSRLWFPEPGKGGDIPSRADFALTRRQFDNLFPKEFWREVVDRINVEMPDTLLLAEAFWLMEGYFVRTLGMHRVYNSAFMNMMMNEENFKYKELITNTLEFEPEILKRYVNFMSNPDEETAIEQFGNGDKYFGVLILMITLPGLPMFAHGQIEGYTEKYGMEYQRAYYNEEPEKWLVERHEHEVFPVLRKRYIFSDVQNFWLYDFLNEDGTLNDNVYIYSNQVGEDKGLVIFNNRYESASGKFFFARQKLSGNSSDSKELINSNIADNLGIKNSDFHFYMMRDLTSGLEYFFNGSEINAEGLFLTLGGYEYRVYLIFEEIFDPTGEAYKFYRENYGKGIYNLISKLEEIKLSQVHISFINLFSKSVITNYIKFMKSIKLEEKDITLFEEEVEEKFLILAKEIKLQAKSPSDLSKINLEFNKSFAENISAIHFIKQELNRANTKNGENLILLLNEKSGDKWLFHFLIKSLFQIRKLFNNSKTPSHNFFSELKLNIPIKEVLTKNLRDPDMLGSNILLINVLIELGEKIEGFGRVSNQFMKLRSPQKLYEYVLENNRTFLTELLNEDSVKAYLEVNTYQGETYFSKDKLEQLLEHTLIYLLFKYNDIVKTKFKTKAKQNSELLRFIKKIYSINNYIKKQSIASKYLYEELLNRLGIKT